MKHLRQIAGTLAGVILFGLAGCSRTINASPPSGPYGGTAPVRQPAPNQGMSTRQKVLLLAGAAALYYMYKKHQNAKGTGPTGQYYRSKNGRIYYRDKRGNPVWVNEPSQPIQVSPEEYQRYFGQNPNSDNSGAGSSPVIRQAPAGW